jgi:hypothetical protein
LSGVVDERGLDSDVENAMPLLLSKNAAIALIISVAIAYLLSLTLLAKPVRSKYRPYHTCCDRPSIITKSIDFACT